MLFSGLDSMQLGRLRLAPPMIIREAGELF